MVVKTYEGFVTAVYDADESPQLLGGSSEERGRGERKKGSRKKRQEETERDSET